jgi:uncharacterized protein (DUF2252 family)
VTITPQHTAATPTLAERRAAGRAARRRVPRSAHGAWSPAPDRPDLIGVMEAQEAGRVPDLLPIRHARMLASPFAFLRGSAGVMAADLATGPSTGLRTQLCGDAHVSNFGAFLAPDRRLVFDLNDFDETHPGPFEWDVKRLAASVEVACRDRGWDAATRRGAVLEAVRTYREATLGFAAMPTLDVWYARLDLEGLLDEARAASGRRERREIDRRVAKVRAKDSVLALHRLTEVRDGRLRIVRQPPLVVPLEDVVRGDDDETVARLRRVLRGYRRTLPADRRHLLGSFTIVDMAHKVVGVGSVGTRAFVVLALGRDDADPLFLQVKEAQASVLEASQGPSAYTSHGRRVVEGQRLMQAASDVMLGWTTDEGPLGRHDYYVRQLWDGKGSFRVERFDPDRMRRYARACGWTLARAHARAGDPVAVAAYLGSGDAFDRAVADFAAVYGDLTEADHAAMAEAAAEGRIRATEEIV